MDNWKFYDIIHRYHDLMNPIDSARLDQLIDLLKLDQGSEVVDIGSGKGEMLFRLVEKYGIKGVGIDKSPYSIRDSENRKNQRFPHADLKFLEMDGAEYKPDREQLAELSMCIGASWIYHGYLGTVKALIDMTRSQGRVMIGEPFWRKEPPIEYLKSEGWSKDLFNSHDGNIMSAEGLGLRPLYSLVSSRQDWDRYEGLHWYAADQHALSSPNDPDLPDLLARVSRDRETYLKWEREYLGWAVYLFRRTG